MLFKPITDWDDAYANMANIPNGETYPGRWLIEADGFRDAMAGENRLEADFAYGKAERNRLDLFLPRKKTRDVLVFVHGGYWMRFDKSFFWHLAAGALERGWAVAMPSYSLCPQVQIRNITLEIAEAVGLVAQRFSGRIALAGHSAGGHLVTRMICSDTPLLPDVVKRICCVLSISGVHDLRPLMRLELNSTLRLDHREAAAESPALHAPLAVVKLICWVGASERSEFLRQNALLANIWHGLGARTLAVEEPDRHHFDVIEALADPQSAMLDLLLE